MQTTTCIRCGKVRIIAKTWTEKTQGTPITYTVTVCPDPECQKIVDRQFKEKKERTDAIKKASLERRMNFRNSFTSRIAKNNKK
ncbi:hypothetical protein HY408_01740 [Candidatus Gottesmanbacteria bacterium]|nr:hypothetical protein [Candidatus Gottesmanbacteria bacterium]